ncbi:MAG: hypothetical protein Q8R40_06795 [bacterium]|nr:hypothetical protein [bacterium]
MSIEKEIEIVNKDEINSDSWTFIDGSKRSISKLYSLIIGRGIYNPGWRWSIHTDLQTGKQSARHIGYIESGKMMIRTENRDEKEVGPGDFFEVGPNHDAWVIGDKPCVALDFESIAI